MNAIKLAQQAMSESCAHFEVEMPTQAELDELYTDAETLWLFQRFAALVRAEALEECALLCDARSERGSPAVAADEAGLIAEQISSMK